MYPMSSPLLSSPPFADTSPGRHPQNASHTAVLLSCSISGGTGLRKRGQEGDEGSSVCPGTLWCPPRAHAKSPATYCSPISSLFQPIHMHLEPDSTPRGFWLVGMEIMHMDVQQAPSYQHKSRFSALFADTRVEAAMPPLRPQSVSGIRARMLSLIDSPLPRL